MPGNSILLAFPVFPDEIPDERQFPEPVVFFEESLKAEQSPLPVLQFAAKPLLGGILPMADPKKKRHFPKPVRLPPVPSQEAPDERMVDVFRGPASFIGSLDSRCAEGHPRPSGTNRLVA